MMCQHVGPVDRHRIEKRFGKREDLRWIGPRYLRCLVCGNKWKIASPWSAAT
jgi:hypothetical protein